MKKYEQSFSSARLCGELHGMEPWRVLWGRRQLSDQRRMRCLGAVDIKLSEARAYWGSGGKEGLSTAMVLTLAAPQNLPLQ